MAGFEATDQVRVSYPHACRAQISIEAFNSQKSNVKKKNFKLIDENSQPTGSYMGSYGAQYYFLPKFTRVCEPKKSEKNSEIYEAFLGL